MPYLKNVPIRRIFNEKKIFFTDDVMSAVRLGLQQKFYTLIS
jgi:hypothetical protein